MLNPNAKIEQLIHTGGGVNRFGHGVNGEFGDWAYSSGLDDSWLRSEIRTMNRFAQDGNYLTSQRDVNGNKIRSFDLMDSKKVILLAESGSDKLNNQCDYDDSFIDTPEKAPFRIIAMQLSDGRLAVCRLGYMNRNYGNEERNGNIFAHTFVFPAGTDVKDIDVKTLKFEVGLNKAYWGRNPNHVKGPSHLPKLSVDEVVAKTSAPQTSTQQVKSQSVKNTSAVVSSTNEIDDLESCILIMTDDNTLPENRVNSARQFSQMRNNGANIDGLCVKLYQQASNALASGDNESVEIAIKAIDKAKSNNTNYDAIFGMVDHYYDMDKRIEQAEAKNDGDKVDELIKLQREYVKNNISKELQKHDVKKLKEVISSRKQLLLEEAKFNAIEGGKDVSTAQAKVRTSDEFNKLLMFERKAITAINKNTNINL